MLNFDNYNLNDIDLSNINYFFIKLCKIFYSFKVNDLIIFIQISPIKIITKINKENFTYLLKLLKINFCLL